ncbi:MAG: hypothetical protein ACKOCW_08020 [Planctomycetaceae bacterium]
MSTAKNPNQALPFLLAALITLLQILAVSQLMPKIGAQFSPPATATTWEKQRFRDTRALAKPLETRPNTTPKVMMMAR